MHSLFLQHDKSIKQKYEEQTTTRGTQPTASTPATLVACGARRAEIPRQFRI